MSGTRQHHVPQFLLRRFARKTGKGWSACVYRRDQAPFTTNITNIAVENGFYESEHESADPTITSQEGAFAQVLADLTDLNKGIDRRAVAGLVNHLVARASHVRSTFSDAATELFNIVGRRLQRVDSFEEFIAFVGEDELRQSIRDLVREGTGGALSADQENIAIDQALRELSAMPGDEQAALVGSIRSESTGSIDELSGMTPELMRNAHVEVMNKDFATSERCALLERLEWVRIQAQSTKLVLGDVVAFGRGTDRTKMPAYWVGKDLCEVWIPITPTILLHGSLPSHSTALSPDEVNRTSIGLSASFFVATDHEPHLEEATKSLGAEWKSQLNKTIGEAVAECLG